MEKIFKKSLALILSAALCLTALVGCLTVSAAEGDTTKPVYGKVFCPPKYLTKEYFNDKMKKTVSG